MGKWLLLFLLTPLVEMYLLLEVGGYIGAWPTIGLVVLTAIIGVGLLRVQGFATLTRGIQRLNQGEMPAREMAEGVLLAIAGALLLTPGFVTDSFGFVLLTPPIRTQLAQWILERVEIRMTARGPAWEPAPHGDPGAAEGSAVGTTKGHTIEGEFEKR
ncbi:MAG: FxsA family protein [Gammaproteobacteria bacterium]|nr:FxsA family protein [Gammaproteobacteria bacterium]